MIIETLLSKRDQLPLELAIIEPEGEAIGIIQLIHGMSEHKERYYDFMSYLSQQGYICAIHDHRGHGASVKDTSHLGYFYTNDITYIVDDAYLVTEYLKNRYPTLNISIFSHSMGTLVSRCYMEKYDFELEKFRKTGKKILELQRYKGLGEMDDTQLWETTLDPESRILAQVSISDTVEADEVTDILMGSNVPPRRQFIMDEAKYANLDI